MNPKQNEAIEYVAGFLDTILTQKRLPSYALKAQAQECKNQLANAGLPEADNHQSKIILMPEGECCRECGFSIAGCLCVIESTDQLGRTGE